MMLFNYPLFMRTVIAACSLVLFSCAFAGAETREKSESEPRSCITNEELLAPATTEFKPVVVAFQLRADGLQSCAEEAARNQDAAPLGLAERRYGQPQPGIRAAFRRFLAGEPTPTNVSDLAEVLLSTLKFKAAEPPNSILMALDYHYRDFLDKTAPYMEAGCEEEAMNLSALGALFCSYADAVHRHQRAYAGFLGLEADDPTNPAVRLSHGAAARARALGYNCPESELSEALPAPIVGGP